jgi:hypothetical protein
VSAEAYPAVVEAVAFLLVVSVAEPFSLLSLDWDPASQKAIFKKYF